MSDRYLRLGNERWHQPPPMTWPWHTSKKGQLYTRNRDGSRVALIWADDTKGVYTFSLSPVDASTKWERSPGRYSTLEDAQRAALDALGVTSATLNENLSPTVNACTIEARAENGPTRRIIL